MPITRKYGVPDDENPEWTKEMWSKALTFSELPPDMQRVLGGKRGPQKAPKKVAVSIRLSQDVAEALRATGAGWQSRVDDILRASIQPRRKASAPR